MGEIMESDYLIILGPLFACPGKSLSVPDAYDLGMYMELCSDQDFLQAFFAKYK